MEGRSRLAAALGLEPPSGLRKKRLPLRVVVSTPSPRTAATIEESQEKTPELDIPSNLQLYNH